MSNHRSRPSWDEYFINIAKVVASRSIDPTTQVGSVIVNHHHRIIGTGYNSFPQGVNDNLLTTSKEQVEIVDGIFASKYDLICHSEVNAIASSEVSLVGCTLYTTLFPCSSCAKTIITAGIGTVKYLETRDKNDFKISKLLMEQAKITLIDLKS
jgi:dCMP deaminase